EDLNSEREGIQNCINNIEESLVRINEIILGMKKFLHETGHDKKEYINLDGVLKTSEKLVASTFEENKVSLKISNKVENAVVLGNKTRLEQVLINLLKNALDSVVHDRTEKPAVELLIEKEKSGHYINLIVIDNGPGVKEENKEKIFENFFTTKEMGEGTGLGLSLCKKIAEDHQGSLELSSATKGAQFTLSLPVIEVSSYASNDEILSKINHIDGKKVLVVDNDATILNLCQKFLDSTPYIFIGSTGGNEALEVLDKYAIDAVITDLQMPGLDGRTFVSKLREKSSDLPVFYLSSSKGMETYQKDKDQLNLSGILLKPFKSEELINLLKSTFSKEGKDE
ncbi:MAG: ATP-binding protein, partial [Halobacteriovoraceae bacterium]|nr:ATP-binding protein [Halobacteriovoraceae bacterium]